MAARLYRKAAEGGLVPAQLELARLYMTRKGAQRDYSEAATWFRRAAEQGNPVGENMIGFMYCLGEGVARDCKEGALWIQKAAEQSNTAALSNLGFLYQNGLGVPLNYSEAYKWLTLAANAGDAVGKRSVEELRSIMTTKQLRDGQAGVADWMSHHNNNLELAAQQAQPTEPDSRAIAAVEP
jgi:TPR repeat protein